MSQRLNIRHSHSAKGGNSLNTGPQLRLQFPPLGTSVLNIGPGIAGVDKPVNGTPARVPCRTIAGIVFWFFYN